MEIELEARLAKAVERADERIAHVEREIEVEVRRADEVVVNSEEKRPKIGGRFGAEVRRGATVRRVYHALSPSRVDRMISWASSSGIADELLHSGNFSFDLHGRTLMSGTLRALLGSVVHLPSRGAPT